MTLAIGHGTDGLVLRHRDALKELAAPRVPPSTLTGEQFGYRHALRLPRRVEDHVGDADLPDRHAALELRARQANGVRPPKGLHVLRPGGHPRVFSGHRSSLLPSLKGNAPWMCTCVCSATAAGPSCEVQTGWARLSRWPAGPGLKPLPAASRRQRVKLRHDERRRQRACPRNLRKEHRFSWLSNL